jgi:glycosyltransferase involved in cell wall biosynthesis
VDSEWIADARNWRDDLSSEEVETLSNLPETFLLGASRAVKYKQLDRVIEAGHRVGIPTVIVGDGPERRRLESLAAELGHETYFLGRASDPLLYSLYQRTHAFIFPPIEDFGIMPVEAMAAGAPVIANQVGGAAETVIDGQTGFLVDFESPESVDLAVLAITPELKDGARRRALEFDRDIFKARIKEWVEINVVN